MISDFDISIGSTSIANGLIMVAENLKDLERISKIKIENWDAIESNFANSGYSKQGNKS